MVVKVKQDKVNIPSKKTVEFLIEGSKVFHPDVFFLKSQAAESPRVDVWTKYKIKREDFDSLLTSYTKKNIYDIENAISIIKEWQEYLNLADDQKDKPDEKPEATVPDKELLEEVDEEIAEFAEKEGKQSPFDLEQQIKTLTRNAQIKKEQEEKLEQAAKPKSPEPERPATAQEIKTSAPIYKAPKPTPPPPAKPLISKTKVGLSGVDSENIPPIYLIPKKLPSPIKLNEQEQEVLNSLVDIAAKTPEGQINKGFVDNFSTLFSENLPEDIKKTVPPDQIDLLTISLATDFFNKLRILGENTDRIDKENYPLLNLTSIYASLSDPNKLIKTIPKKSERERVAQNAQESALLTGTKDELTTQIVNKIFGLNITQTLYGPPEIVEYETSEQPEGSIASIDINKMFKAYKKLKPNLFNYYKDVKAGNYTRTFTFTRSLASDISSQMFSIPKSRPAITRSISLSKRLIPFVGTTTAYTYSRGFVTSYFSATNVQLLASPEIAGLLTAPGFAATNMTTISVMGGTLLDLRVGNLAAVKIQAGYIKELGLGAIKTTTKFGVKETAKTTIAKLSPKAAVLAAKVIPKIAGLVGWLATPVGAVIAWIGTEVIIKGLSWLKKKIKSNPGNVLLVTTAIFVVLGVVISPIFIVPAIFLGAGVLATAATGTAVGAGIAGFFGTIALGFTTLFVSSIIVPLIIAFIAIPTIVGLTIFIINSGAYVVPPSGGGAIYGTTGAVESPWIGVTKSATPSDFDNDKLPEKVTYTVTVWAKKATLTNISYNNVCKVRKEGFIPVCDHPEPEEDDLPKTISPQDGQQKFTYEVEYDSNYEDSLVIDTFEVTADVPDAPGAFATAVAFVSIGDPPSDCPVIWPVSGRQRITQGPGPQHRGPESIDIGVGTGTPISVTHSGVVTASLWDLSSTYGNYIDIQSTCDGKVSVSRYAHLSSRLVKKGDNISVGSVIGLSGGTGGWAPHLHYEFRGLKMETPYIPRSIPLGCTSVSVCGYTEPSN